MVDILSRIGFWIYPIFIFVLSAIVSELVVFPIKKVWEGLHESYLLRRGKLVVGSTVSGFVYDPAFDERDPMRPFDTVVNDGKFPFDVKVPYPDMDESETMTIEESNRIIKEAIYKKYNKNYRSREFTLNNVGSTSDVIIPVEELDLKPRENK